MKDIRELVAQVAPTLAAAMSGPFSGVATKYMADKLLSHGSEIEREGGSIEEALKTVLMDATGLQKLKELDKNFLTEMRKLDIDVFTLEVDDRKSARVLAEKDNKPQVVMSIAFITAYFVLLGAVFWAEVSPSYNPGMAFKNGEWVEQAHSLIDLFKVLIGVLTAGVGQILSFWFGGVKKTSTTS